MVLETNPGFFIGPVFIYYYGIVYALAALVLYVTLLKKRVQLGLNETQVDTFLISILLGLLVGGRIFHFLVNDPSIFISNPLQLLWIREGGMSFFGAAIGVMSGAFLWYKRLSKSTQQQISMNTLFRVLDYGAVVVSVALIFGRLANFLNQELVGRIADPASITWCVEFATVSGCRHPYQLYAAASHVVLFAIVLFALLRNQKASNAGCAIATFFTTYGILRFITDFWRDDTIVFVGLTVWQLFAIGLTIVGAYFLWRIRHTNTQQIKNRLSTKSTSTKVKNKSQE